jgi:hypothetical protein
VGQSAGHIPIGAQVRHGYIPELQKAVGDRYHVQHQVDPTTPDSGEVEIYGLQKAKERARRRFLDNAVNAISNGWCEGPGQCYRRAAELHGLDARLGEALHCEGFDEKVWHERGYSPIKTTALL